MEIDSSWTWPSSPTMVTLRSRPTSSTRTEAGELGHRRRALGGAGFEELDHAGQTVGDVALGHTTGVEGAHGELGTRLANGLGRDDADRLTELDELVGGEREAVARGADALNGVTGERGAHAHAGHGRVVAQALDVVHQQHGARRDHRAVARA